MVFEARLASLAAAIGAGDFQVTTHAATQLTKRRIRIADALAALQVAEAEVIENYPDDKRGASCLVLSWVGGRAVHIVVSFPPTPELITAYWPDERSHEWDPTFRRRV